VVDIAQMFLQRVAKRALSALSDLYHHQPSWISRSSQALKGVRRGGTGTDVPAPRVREPGQRLSESTSSLSSLFIQDAQI